MESNSNFVLDKCRINQMDGNGTDTALRKQLWRTSRHSKSSVELIRWLARDFSHGISMGVQTPQHMKLSLETSVREAYLSGSFPHGIGERAAHFRQNLRVIPGRPFLADRCEH